MNKKIYFIILSSMILLTGCSKTKLVTDHIDLELGQTLSEDPTKYLADTNEVYHENLSIDFSEINFEKVGVYDAYLINGNEKIKINVEIKDTKSPEVEFNDQYIICKLNEEINVNDLIKEIKDKSNTNVGFIYNEKVKELKDVSKEEINSSKIIEEENKEKYNNLELKETLTFNEEGVYDVIVAAEDEFNNRSLFKINVYADGTAPVISGFEDQYKKFDGLPTGALYDVSKVTAIDNLDGDLTDNEKQAYLEEEYIETDKYALSMKIHLFAEDRAGNKSEEIFDVNIDVNIDDILNSPINNPDAYKEIYEVKENHFDKNKAKEEFDLVNQQRINNGLPALVWDESLYDFACERATQIINNFSHYLPDGTYVPEYLYYKSGGSNIYGENIAENYTSTTNLINAWMNSPGHRENILYSDWNYGVMACYYCNGGYHWVNLFRS